VNLNSPSPATTSSLLKPQYVFWLLIFAELCLVAFIIVQFPQVREQRVRFISLREKCRDQAGQAGEIQAQLQSLAGDLLQLADSDSQAQALVAKYQIRR
jgi:hypothetical protein